MKKKVIGYIHCDRKLTKEDKFFIESARKKGVELEIFNLCNQIDEEELEEKAKKCDVIFNNSAEEFAIEIVKTLETLGKKVICSSEDYYTNEDKWTFFLKCKKNKIPAPQTILLSENINNAKEELKKINWPIILKRVEGSCGNYVSKAENERKAIATIKKFWKKGNQRLPIIAQELIKSPSYRVLLIDKKIIQAIIKTNKSSWKSTGVYGKKFKKFEVDNELKKIINKLTKITPLEICGIDFLKKDGKWIVLEINSSPGLDFMKSEWKNNTERIIDFLKKN